MQTAKVATCKEMVKFLIICIVRSLLLNKDCCLLIVASIGKVHLDVYCTNEGKSFDIMDTFDKAIFNIVYLLEE